MVKGRGGRGGEGRGEWRKGGEGGVSITQQLLQDTSLPEVGESPRIGASYRSLQ